MIESIPSMPVGTLGFRLWGRIERADYADVLVPALTQAAENRAEMRTLFVVDELERMDPGALWADAKNGFDMTIAHRANWKRTAFVSDQTWLVESARLFGWMISGLFRTFPVADLEQAKTWVGEPTPLTA
jgi:hypothetical protein